MTVPDKLQRAAIVLHDVAQEMNRGWEQAGIRSKVAEAVTTDGRTLWQVLRAGLDALADPKAQTPAAIRFECYYTGTASTDAESRDLGPKCWCGTPEQVHERKESRVSPDARHPFALPQDRETRPAKPREGTP